MKMNRYDALQVGDELPTLATAPITRQTLGLYAAASGDDNPLHIDPDFARRAGMSDVFAHGMLSMAYLSRLLTNWVDQAAIRSMSVRFMALTHVGDRVFGSASVAEKFVEMGESRALLNLTARNQNGVVTLSGQAIIALE